MEDTGGHHPCGGAESGAGAGQRQRHPHMARRFPCRGAMLTDELKSGHIERVARRELAQECDNLTEVLAFERDQLKATGNSTARAFRRASCCAE